ncbi:MAG: thiopurine S-methyltransferase, partial [Polyangiales bacterium]
MSERALWEERWSKQQIGFHEGKPNELLVAHEGRLAPPGKKLRILVPLAGKTADLGWLSARGH